MVVFWVVFGHRHVTLATTLDNLKFLVDVKDEEDMHHVRFPKIYHILIVSKMFFIASTLYNSVFTGTGVIGSACTKLQHNALSARLFYFRASI